MSSQNKEVLLKFDKSGPKGYFNDMLSHIEKRLLMAILVTFFILAGEVVGGLLSNSLALLSDAGHNLTDILALGLSLIYIHRGISQDYLTSGDKDWPYACYSSYRPCGEPPCRMVCKGGAP